MQNKIPGDMFFYGSLKRILLILSAVSVTYYSYIFDYHNQQKTQINNFRYKASFNNQYTC